ncbi:MAG TPA: hypothetical protein VEQ86_06745 [Xanthobacteraceae bacterium]|nr:hypothetical protein [Xanthobacteraceae bacterium]
MSVQTGAQNLTGVWNGLYTYSDGRSISFVATLIDGGGSLTGTTHEPDSRSNVTLYATLGGTHHDGAVTFTKTYERPDRYHRNPIFYTGALNGDSTEIEGRWVISPRASGKFLMTRPAPRRAKVAQTAFEKA